MNFRDYFKYNGEDYAPSYRLFFNEASGNYELVARSGDIVSIIPRPSWASPEQHLEIAKTIFHDIHDGLMNDDNEVCAPFVLHDELHSLFDEFGCDSFFDCLDLPIIHYSPAS